MNIRETLQVENDCYLKVDYAVFNVTDGITCNTCWLTLIGMLKNPHDVDDVRVEFIIEYLNDNYSVYVKDLGRDKFDEILSNILNSDKTVMFIYFDTPLLITLENDEEMYLYTVQSMSVLRKYCREFEGYDTEEFKIIVNYDSAGIKSGLVIDGVSRDKLVDIIKGGWKEIVKE
jgi:hypothetical protein